MSLLISITNVFLTNPTPRSLLAAPQMDRVFATRTVKGIKSTLASMPQRIDELYRLTLERIQKQAGDDGTLAMRILSWIIHARRPLSVNELRHCLAVEYDEDEDYDLNLNELDTDDLLQPESLVDVCAGLVIIDSTSQIIWLVIIQHKNTSAINVWISSQGLRLTYRERV